VSAPVIGETESRRGSGAEARSRRQIKSATVRPPGPVQRQQRPRRRARRGDAERAATAASAAARREPEMQTAHEEIARLTAARGRATEELAEVQREAAAVGEEGEEGEGEDGG